MTVFTYPIITERLLIRPFAADDREALLAMRSMPVAARYPFTEPMAEHEVDEAIRRRIVQPAFDGADQTLYLAAVLRQTGGLIGDLSLVYRSHQHRQGEIGFIIHPDHQGRGLAREGVVELLRLGFEVLGLHRMYGRCDAGNAASIGLMRRIGMRQEAHLRENRTVNGEWTDELVFAMLRDEWAPDGW